INISPEVMMVFKTHPWPGNIRQLHNVLRTALALADGDEISETHLTQDFIDELQVLNLGNLLRPKIASPKTLALDDLAEDAIRSAMQQHAGNVSAVARQLGISRNTLYRKLKLIELIS
ncbi:MAG: helix-turn-helix domain-containing protein, partial [Pseudomonadota bacterium]